MPSHGQEVRPPTPCPTPRLFFTLLRVLIVVFILFILCVLFFSHYARRTGRFTARLRNTFSREK